MIDDNCIKNNLKSVADLRSEKLYREAEDDFHHFTKPHDALEKLDKAIGYSPNFIKGLRFKGDILFLIGKHSESLEAYKAAEVFSEENPQIYAGIANAYYMLEKYQEAMEYVQKGFGCEKKPFGGAYKLLFDLKTSILINSGKYSEAEKTIKKARYKLFTSELDELRVEKLSLIKQKKEILNKIKRSRLKVVK